MVIAFETFYKYTLQVLVDGEWQYSETEMGLDEARITRDELNEKVPNYARLIAIKHEITQRVIE